jgi:glycyl-tRNA synthetase beta chain
LEFYLKEALGFRYDVVNAVLAAGSDDVVNVITRAQAVAKICSSPDFEAISVGFRRIRNILKQAAEKKLSIPEDIDESLFDKIGTAETDLYMNGVVNIQAEYELRRRGGNYDLALSHAASLRPPLDRFFDEVMVMTDDEKTRANRLALLQRLHQDFSTIADFSEMVTEGKSAGN